MSKITVSAELAALLRASNGKSELCDPNGQPIGFFVPPIDLYAEPTPEQLKASAAAGGGISHAEAMKRLGLE